MKSKDNTFSVEKAEESSGFLLWQTTMIWQRKIKKSLEPYDISHAQFVIMAVMLWFNKHAYDTTQTGIINWTKLDKMTVSKSIKKLMTQGLLTQVEHAKDTRAKSVSLTEEGNKLIHKLVHIVENIDAAFFGYIPVDDNQSLIRMLNKLAEQP